jgi:hypothetical protein
MDATLARSSIILTQPGLAPAIDLRRVEAVFSQCDDVALDIDEYCRALISPLKPDGKRIWCDIHPDFVEAAEYLFFSSDLLPDYRPFMQRMQADGKRLVVCTYRRAGSSALTSDGQWYDAPSLPGI